MPKVNLSAIPAQKSRDGRNVAILLYARSAIKIGMRFKLMICDQNREIFKFLPINGRGSTDFLQMNQRC